MNASKLRAWRAKYGLSPKDAAELLQISVRTLNGLEQGRSLTSPLWGPIGRLIELIGPVKQKEIA